MTTRELNALYARLGIQPPPGIAVPDASKYNATKKMVDGILFDSAGEARAFQVLRSWAVAGAITGLELQPRFLLQERFRDSAGKAHRQIEYRADFRFLRDGKPVVVDYKGVRTPTYGVKIKLFLARYPELAFEEWNLDTLRQFHA